MDGILKIQDNPVKSVSYLEVYRKKLILINLVNFINFSHKIFDHFSLRERGRFNFKS